MSTKIKTIKGSYHYHIRKGTFDVIHSEAEISLIRFFNGKDRGVNIQLSVYQAGDDNTSYIHLNKKQCKELAKALNECFDNNKYPSE